MSFLQICPTHYLEIPTDFSTMKVQLSESELYTAALVYIIRDTVGLAQKNFWIIASDNQTVSHPLVI